MSNLTAIFSNIQLQLARYIYCPLYITGNIGNILNLIVFSQRKLRTMSVCSWYFLAVSISNLIAINTGYLTRILTYMGFPDPSRTVGFYCIGRVFIQMLSLTLSRHFLCSIIIDRFLVTSTSVKLRQISSFKMAKWYISLSVLCWTIFYSHIWVGYSGTQPGSACKKQNGAYTLFITICSMTIDAILPIIFMIAFSLLTFNNLHGLYQRRNRIIPMINSIPMTIIVPTTINISNDKTKQNHLSNQLDRQEKRKIDKQLTLISLIQVIIYLMFNTLNASFSLYNFITSSIIRSADRAAIESFISAISIMLTFIYGTVS